MSPYHFRITLPKLKKSFCKVIILLTLLTTGTYASEGNNVPDAYYPADNDAEYKPPHSIVGSNSRTYRYPADNDEEYNPVILQGTKSATPAKKSYPYPVDNDAEYKPITGKAAPDDNAHHAPMPSDNDAEYQAPQPQTGSGGKTFYPLYY